MKSHRILGQAPRSADSVTIEEAPAPSATKADEAPADGAKEKPAKETARRS